MIRAAVERERRGAADFQAMLVALLFSDKEPALKFTSAIVPLRRIQCQTICQVAPEMLPEIRSSVGRQRRIEYRAAAKYSSRIGVNGPVKPSPVAKETACVVTAPEGKLRVRRLVHVHQTDDPRDGLFDPLPLETPLTVPVEIMQYVLVLVR